MEVFKFNYNLSNRFFDTGSYIGAGNLKTYLDSNRTSNDIIKSVVNYTMPELETLEVDPDVEYKYANIVLNPENYG